MALLVAALWSLAIALLVTFLWACNRISRLFKVIDEQKARISDLYRDNELLRWRLMAYEEGKLASLPRPAEAVKPAPEETATGVGLCVGGSFG